MAFCSGWKVECFGSASIVTLLQRSHVVGGSDEAETRMEGVEQERSNHDHDGVEHNKFVFLAHDGVAPTTAQLCNSVAASYEDAQESDEDSCEK